MTKTKLYKAAVIGAGSGGTLSINALAASDRYQLVAIADPRQSACDAIQAKYPEVDAYSNHHDLFAAQELDIVCISTWATSHLEITRDALALPLVGLLVEKPLADNVADARELLSLIKAQQLPVAVPHGLLVAPHVLEIIHLVHSGAIGDLRLVEIQCRGWDIINAGIHWLNFVVTLLNREAIDWVMACCDTSTQTYRDNIQVETIAVTYAQSRSGVRVVMNTGDYVQTNEAGKDTVFRLVGTLGTIDFYAWESAYRIFNAAHPQGSLIQVDPGAKSRHQLHLDNLAAQIDSGQADYRVADSSLMALEICEAAFMSSQHQCAVTLPLHAFTPPAQTAWQLGKPYNGSSGGRDGRQLPELEDGRLF